MAVAVFVWLLRWARTKTWWPRGRAIVSVLLAVGMAGSVVWQRAATRSAYAGGGRDYTVFAEAVAAGIAEPAGTEVPVVCDYMIWGGNLTAQKAFFQRYADTDTNAHALQVWRAEEHTEETVYRLGISRGEDKAYDAAWLGLGADTLLDTVTEVTVYLPERVKENAVLHYTIRTPDGQETEYVASVQELYTGDTGDGGHWLKIPGNDPVIGDSIRLDAE